MKTENPENPSFPITNEEMTAAAWLREGERIDDLQRSGLRIIQDPARFCFGMDAVLLSGFAAAREGDTVLDLGTGTGILPLLLFAKTGAAVLYGLEIQEASADMAARSVSMNGLDDKIHIIKGDIKEADRIFAAASFDVITSNPPYMLPGHGLTGDQDARTIARHEVLCTFEDVADAASKLLKPGGHFYLVHRPFRLPELMNCLTAHQLEPKRMKLVYPYIDQEPNMVLLDCVRRGKPRLTVEKPLIVYEAPGRYTREIYDVYGY